jgi:DNA-binding beta-propeller fold protein YncE
MSPRFIIGGLLALAACGSESSHQPDPDAHGQDAATDAQMCTDTSNACACEPVAPGASGMLTPSRTIAKLAHDPTRCLLYALADTQILVFDTKDKVELAPIELPSAGIDLDVSRDGARLVVAHRFPRGVTVIDLAQRTLVDTLSTSAEPGRLEVTSAGTVFYVSFDQSNSAHRLDLATGTEMLLKQIVGYQVDIELSPDESRLFVGESGTSGDRMMSFDVSAGGFTQVDQIPWHLYSRYSSSPRRVLASKAGNVYWAGHQWRADNLGDVTGAMLEDVFAENDAGTIAIGRQFAWDVATGYKTKPIAGPVLAAAFVADGREAWMFSGGVLRYMATSELEGPHPLGVRELPPLALGEYALDQLIHDGSRGVLYGRDSSRHAIVLIDDTTLQPTREIRVGGRPSDMALDPTRSALYVGHEEIEALAVVDLSDSTFDRFVQTPRRPYQIAQAGPGRVIVSDRDYDSAPTLFDLASGNAAPTTILLDYAAIAVTPDGKTLYAGEAGLGGDMYKFTITANNLALISATTTNPHPSAVRRLIPHPSEPRVFFARKSISTTDLTTVNFTTEESILNVSSDGRFALSATTVYDASTGADLGLLPANAPVQTVDAGAQKAYLLAPAGILTVDLSTYAP